MRIRLLLLVDILVPGGLERKTARIATSLDPTRFEVLVGWSKQSGPLSDELQASGISTLHLPRHDRSAIGVLRALNIDILHSLSGTRSSDDVLAAKAAGIPVILTARFNMRHWDTEGRLQDWEIERNRATQAISAVSAAVADLVSSVEGYPRERISVIRNGVPAPDEQSHSSIRQVLNLPATAFVIGYLAAYRDLKAHDVLLDAFAQIAEQTQDAYLVCAGHNYHGYEERVREMVAERRLAQRTLILPSHDDVTPLYRSFDVYAAHSSLTEGCSNSILEAMMHGLPVVATKYGRHSGDDYQWRSRSTGARRR